MKNTAFIRNDGVCVYFNSKINIGNTAKILYIIFNFAFIAFYSLMIIITLPDKPIGSDLVVIFIVLPSLYVFTLGKSTFWNFFGEEYIVINLKSISHSRSYGFFKTELKSVSFKRLSYQINLDRIYDGKSSGTISFLDYNHKDVPIVIFTTGIYLSGDILDEVIKNIYVIYSIEHLFNAGDNFIHLN